MSIVPLSGTSSSITAEIDGRTCVIPRVLGNADYVAMMGLSGVKVSGAQGVYKSLPDLRRVRTALVGIWSSGPAHGESDRQQLGVSFDEGRNWRTTDFYIDPIPPETEGTYDFSLLDDVLEVGEKIILKVWTVERTATGYTAAIVNELSDGVNIYAPWSAPVQIGDTWYRTGYTRFLADVKSALFTSPVSDAITWTFVAVIASAAGKDYGETGLCLCADGDLLAIVREDNVTGRPLHYTRSSSLGGAWGALTAFDQVLINGTQPMLLRMANDEIVLLAGDRSGFTGMSNNGLASTAEAITGISAWKSTDHGVAWTSRSMLAPMWSTDGGQPAAVEMADGTVGFLCYLAAGPTNSESGIEPEVWFFRFASRNLI